MDDLVEGQVSAGQAAKATVLVALPLGLSPTAFDPQGDGATDLVAIMGAGLAPDGSYGSFNDTLYAAVATRAVGRKVPASTVAYVRAAQEASGGWDFGGDSGGDDADVDTTALGVQALVVARARPDDPDLREALGFLADRQQASGAWQAFGSDDPNSTSLATMAVTGAGYDPTEACWRDVVAPELAGEPYASPTGWLVSQQAPDGHITSPNDTFGVNTFATSQSIQALRRGWMPPNARPPQDCP